MGLTTNFTIQHFQYRVGTLLPKHIAFSCWCNRLLFFSSYFCCTCNRSDQAKTRAWLSVLDHRQPTVQYMILQYSLLI